MKRLAIVILLIAFMATSVLPVMAGDELSEAKNEKSSIDSRISKLNQQKKEVLKEKTKLEQANKKLANQQAAEANAYQELVNQITDAEENLRKTENALAEAISNYNQQRELVKKRLKVMYQNSSTSVLDTLLESSSLVEFYERLQYMSIIAENDSDIIEDLNEAKLDVEFKKKLQQDAKALLELNASNKQERMTQLKASRAEVEGEIARSKNALSKLEKEIDAQIEESRRLNSVIKNLSKRKLYAGGSMVWPCPSSSNITSSYGTRKHPILRKYKMHTGIDIGADKGSSIVAANKGTVIMAHYDRSGGYGNMVVIDHGGGVTTLYAHASKLLVKVGKEVKAGEVIAKVGSTGLSTGNHLHFEVRIDGVTKNPMSGYLSK